MPGLAWADIEDGSRVAVLSSYKKNAFGKRRVSRLFQIGTAGFHPLASISVVVVVFAEWNLAYILFPLPFPHATNAAFHFHSVVTMG